MKILILIIIVIVLFSQSFSFADDEVKTAERKIVLDQKILVEDETKGINTLFKDMVVVQKKVFERRNKFVLFSNLSFDFSDSPKTMYTMAFGGGYALFENIELSLSVSPFFISNDRPTVKAVNSLILQDGKIAELITPEPKLITEGSVLWAFAYGKDAMGPFSIIRSDTFLKFAYSSIQFKEGSVGNRLALYAGKTFFISKLVNFRFSVGVARQTSLLNGKSQPTNIGLIEPGFVFFL